jgi:hypothetical protein
MGDWYFGGSDQLVAGCKNSGLGPVIDTKFVKYVNDVAFYSVRTYGKLPGDLVVGKSFGHKP